MNKTTGKLENSLLGVAHSAAGALSAGCHYIELHIMLKVQVCLRVRTLKASSVQWMCGSQSSHERSTWLQELIVASASRPLRV
jgi:hypothetical protein